MPPPRRPYGPHARPPYGQPKPKAPPDTETIVATFTHCRAGPRLPRPGGGTFREPGETIHTSTYAIVIHPHCSYQEMMEQCTHKVQNQWAIQMLPGRWFQVIYVTLSKEAAEPPLTVSDDMTWRHARRALCQPDGGPRMEFKYFELPEGEWVESEMRPVRPVRHDNGCECCVLQ
ncbi:hypothetical protein Tdes44962_MAKER07792 [Teratosphaeria destructans]|uniref:Uncharacterized protein n=1 Tax=Teratosphaeria destructans TaxID=418781 RepID=A0A9W7W5V8_9PEZI|nr:hypothetical protein Tdes44962_MAKER07792 [Teratosphaeria destructans]